jgi:hypothetical protein
MKKLILPTIFMLFLDISGFSQNPDSSSTKKNTVYLEGYLIRPDFSSGFVSINYERNIGKKRKTNLRIGIHPDIPSAISFPLTISWLTKPLGYHHFDYGIGAVIRIEHFVAPYGGTSKEWFFDIGAIMLPLMYRYQRATGFFFRGGINLFVSWPTLPSPSISLGYRF